MTRRSSSPSRSHAPDRGEGRSSGIAARPGWNARRGQARRLSPASSSCWLRTRRGGLAQQLPTARGSSESFVGLTSLPISFHFGPRREFSADCRDMASRGARPGKLPTIAGHRPSHDAKSPFSAPVAPTTYGRAIRSGSTFSPPAICGCDGTKPLRASRCPTNARANANVSFSRVVRRSATLKKASPK